MCCFKVVNPLVWQLEMCSRPLKEKDVFVGFVLLLCSAGHRPALYPWWLMPGLCDEQTHQSKQISSTLFLQTSSLTRPNKKDMNWHIHPILNENSLTRPMHRGFFSKYCSGTLSPVCFHGVRSTGAAVSLQTTLTDYKMGRRVKASSKPLWSERGADHLERKQWQTVQRGHGRDVVSVDTVHTHE